MSVIIIPPPHDLPGNSHSVAMPIKQDRIRDCLPYPARPLAGKHIRVAFKQLGHPVSDDADFAGDGPDTFIRWRLGLAARLQSGRRLHLVGARRVSAQ
jgi:hypothetical protein